MNHFINAIGIDDSVMYLLGNQCIAFTRHTNGNTIIQLATGAILLTKTTPEILEQRLNKYNDDVFDYMSRKREDNK